MRSAPALLDRNGNSRAYRDEAEADGGAEVEQRRDLQRNVELLLLWHLGVFGHRPQSLRLLDILFPPARPPPRPNLLPCLPMAHRVSSSIG